MANTRLQWTGRCGASRRSQLKGHMTSRGIFWMVLALVGHHHCTSLQPLPGGDMLCDSRPPLRETKKQTIVGCRVWRWVLCCFCLVLCSPGWPGLELTVQTRPASDSQISTCFCLLSTGVKGKHHEVQKCCCSHISNTHHEVTVRTAHLGPQFSAF